MNARPIIIIFLLLGHDTATLAPDVQEIFFTAATYREFTTPIPSYAIRGKCQKADFIAYEEDCRKFINCFIDPTRIQKCAPGLLFNKETRECNLESKVICNNCRLIQTPSLKEHGRFIIYFQNDKCFFSTDRYNNETITRVGAGQSVN